MTTTREIVFDSHWECDGTECPVCDDTMTTVDSNLLPTWSDHYDNVVCWWCSVHPQPYELLPNGRIWTTERN